MATAVDETVIHILWINAGLSCDGDSVALTGATQPSIEEIALGALGEPISGLPRLGRAGMEVVGVSLAIDMRHGHGGTSN